MAEPITSLWSRRARLWVVTTLLGLWVWAGGAVVAADATVAVAANFAVPAEQLRQAFERGSRHRVRLVTGSTGTLYAQIVNGAPFDLFLAADRRRPAALVDGGWVAEDGRRTYALGRLVLWSADRDRLRGRDGPAVLSGDSYRRLAIANPRLAPYGAAAEQTLTALGLRDRVAARLVRAENVGQAFTFVVTGQAALGFVALSSIRAHGEAGGKPGSSWPVPARLHEPIAQDAVLLSRARDNAAARAFFAFLTDAEADETLRRFGYERP